MADSMRGADSTQDTRFKDKEAASIKATKFPPHFSEKVDLRKVNVSVLRPWIAKRVTELIRVEDDVVVEYVYSLLEDRDKPVPDPKKLQVALVGFMDKYGAAAFMDELWKLLLSAQSTVGGVPAEFIAAKKAEIEAAQKAGGANLDDQQRARAEAAASRDGGGFRDNRGSYNGGGYQDNRGGHRGDGGYRGGGGGGSRRFDERDDRSGGRFGAERGFGGDRGYGRDNDRGYGRGGRDDFRQRERDSGYGARSGREREPPRDSYRRRSPSPRRRSPSPPPRRRREPSRSPSPPRRRKDDSATPPRRRNRSPTVTPPRRAVRDDTPPRRGGRDDTPPRRGPRDDTPPRRGARDDTPPRGGARDDTPPRRSARDDTPPRGGRHGGDDATPPRHRLRSRSPSGSGRTDTLDEAESAKRAKKLDGPLAKSRWA